jgi:hypothetical protein
LIVGLRRVVVGFEAFLAKFSSVETGPLAVSCKSRRYELLGPWYFPCRTAGQEARLDAEKVSLQFHAQHLRTNRMLLEGPFMSYSRNGSKANEISEAAQPSLLNGEVRESIPFPFADSNPGRFAVTV